MLPDINAPSEEYLRSSGRREGRTILVLDLGGSGIRALAVGDDGRVVVSDKKGFNLVYPSSASPGGVEFADDVWDTAVSVLRSVAIMLPRESRVEAITCTSMREGFFLLDSEGQTVYAGPNIDRRAVKECEEFAECRGEELFRLTGQPVFPPVGSIHAPFRLMWLARHEPARLRRARLFLMIADWLAFQLTGVPACEMALATSSGLVNIRSLEWSWDLLGDFGLSHIEFPRLIHASARIGGLRGELADLVGLPEGIPVVAAGPDTQCALLGCKGVRPGDTAIVAGTTAPIQRVVASLRPTATTDTGATTDIWTSSHVVPGMWVYESNAGHAGFVYQWFAGVVRDIVGSFGMAVPIPMADIYARADEWARDAPPGAGGLRADMGPRVMDIHCALSAAEGALVGIHDTGPRATTKGHLVRALMENIAFSFAGNVEQLDKAYGSRSQEVWLTGGLARSEAICQMVADVLGLPVRVPLEVESAAVGAALCAMVGGRVFSSWEEAADTVIRPSKTLYPDPERLQQYRQLFANWISLHRARIAGPV
ncbi:MAG: FGGY-family carbohydrate kinase [Bacillota bacterium]|nr:FGGY-family carbohydrate kinase [Bacillota bacterium]